MQYIFPKNSLYTFLTLRKIFRDYRSLKNLRVKKMIMIKKEFSNGFNSYSFPLSGFFPRKFLIMV